VTATVSGAAIPNRLFIMLSIILATMLQAIDSTIANVALPHIQGSMAAPQDQIAWVLTSYIVATAIMTPLTGFLANRFGRKRLLLLSTIGFTTASALCGLATSLEQIVGFRLLQGVAGAALVPLAQAILLDIYPGQEQGKAMGYFGIGVMIGPILGPTLGGFLTEFYDWRWVFFINVPFGLLAVAGIALFVPETKRERDRRFDFFGFGLLSVGIGALQLALDRGQSLNWFNSVEIIVELVLAGLCLYLFVVHMLTAKQQPFLEAGLFANRNFVAGLVFNFMAAAVMITSLALLPVFLQNLMGIPVITAGFLMAPRGIGTLFAMIIASRLYGRIDMRWTVLVGVLLTALSMEEMSRFSLNMDNWTIFRTGLVQGLGLGLVLMPVGTLSLAGLAPHYRNEGAALFALIRNMGGSISIAVAMGAIATGTQSHHALLAEAVTPFRDATQPGALPALWNWTTTAGAMVLNQELTRQAASIAYFNVFAAMQWLALLTVPLLLLFKDGGPRTGRMPVEHLD
jgi:DHA2 family multidrug resistance protein